MTVSESQKRQLFEHGWLRAPGAVRRDHVERVRRKIHHSIGQHGIDPNELWRYRAQSYCPELRDDPDVTGLCTDSGAWDVLEALLGAGQVAPPPQGQLALRFPSMAETPKQPNCHLDGMPTPSNEGATDRIEHFTCLLGVLLADMPEPNHGNFTVWPGAHRQCERWFQQHGARSLLTDGMPKIDYPEPVQVTGQAGDIVIAHYLLPHSNGPHLGPDIRYMCFFRMKRVDHDTVGDRCMTDAWCEWDGMRDIAASGAA